MKTAIIYASFHHKNTEKLVKAMAEAAEITLFDITKEQNIDISSFDCVGFASGVYRHFFHNKIIEFVKNNNFENKPKVFIVCTCGFAYLNYARIFKKNLDDKNLECLGSFTCRGFDTEMFKSIGGIAKGHPNAKDLKKAKEFIKKTLNKL